MPPSSHPILLFLVVLSAVLIGAPAGVRAGSPAEDAARAAHEALADHCADVAAREASLVASSVVSVSAVWEDVGRQYETSAEPYLLYWRGVLAQCLGFEELAVADLTAFHAQELESAVHAGLVQDARRRLRRLGVDLRSPPPSLPPVQVAGLSLLGGGGLLGGLSGLSARQQALFDESRQSQPMEASERAVFEQEHVAMVHRTNLLLGLGIGCGISAVVLMVAGAPRTGASSARRTGPTSLQPRLAIAPGGEEVLVEAGVSWRW